MQIAFGADHAGLELKTFLTDELRKQGHEITDCGTFTQESVDYPDFAAKVCDLVRAGEVRFGVLICATGIGISIAANKRKGIRAALCGTELAGRLSREHNDANVLVLGAMITGKLLALSIAETFLGADFSRGERHERRIRKMMSFEEN